MLYTCKPWRYISIAVWSIINLSHAAVLHPEVPQLQMNTLPLNIHGSDYYMFTSYVMPEAQLHISDIPHKTGDYPVTFKVG